VRKCVSRAIEQFVNINIPQTIKYSADILDVNPIEIFDQPANVI
jgi:hypothetical protein